MKFLTAMFEQVPQQMKTGIAYGAASTSVFGTILGVVQPFIAVVAGLCSTAYLCMQMYDWVQKKRKGGS